MQEQEITLKNSLQTTSLSEITLVQGMTSISTAATDTPTNTTKTSILPVKTTSSTTPTRIAETGGESDQSSVMNIEDSFIRDTNETGQSSSTNNQDDLMEYSSQTIDKSQQSSSTIPADDVDTEADQKGNEISTASGAGPDESLVSSSQQSETELLDSLVGQAKDEAQKAREMTESSFLELYELKMKELALEEELIHLGKHPEYLHQLNDIEQKKELRFQQSANRLRYAIQNCEAEFDAGVKLAQDSFDYAKRVLKWQLMTRQTGNRFQLQAEFDIASKSTGTIPTMSATPLAVFKQRRIYADDSIFPPSNDFEPVEERPTWARTIVRKRKRAGYLRTWIPPMCSGLDENEIDEDLCFIRLVSSEKNLAIQ